MHGTDAIVPIQVGIVGHSPLMEVGNTLVSSGLGPVEIGVLVNSYIHAPVDLDGTDFIVERDLGNVRTTLAEEIVARKISAFKKTSSAPRPVTRTSSTAGVPPAGATTTGLDAELGAAASIHPDASFVVAPRFAANALLTTELLNQNDNGARVAHGTVLDTVMARFTGDGISGWLVLSGRFRWRKQTNHEHRNQERRQILFRRHSPVTKAPT